MKSLLNLFVRVHVALFRATKGRVASSMEGIQLLLLTTTGRKTGKKRTVPVMYFEDGGRRFIVASAGGNAKHPAWYANLQANPEVVVEVPGQSYEARATAVTPEVRAHMWQKIVEQAPRFGGYANKTEGKREIPVVELQPN